MKGMAATYEGPRAGRVDFRGRARALARATRKFGALGTSGDSVEARPWAVRVKPDSDKELLEELRKALTWMKALEGGQVDRTPKQASIAGSDIKEPRRIPRKRHGSATLRRRAVAVLALSLLIAVSAGWVLFQKGAVQKNPFDTSRPRWKDESATHFTFAAAGDFGGPGNNDSLGLVGRARTAGMSFFLALGDLGYTTSASGWCTQMKRLVPEIVIIAGDDGSNADGNMSQYVASCPYPLSSPMVAGKGTPGYGYEYYFDYPREKPLARFILLSAGLSGVDYNYSRKSPHTEWVEDKVASARDAGIPWVIAGVHKECITVGNDGHCPMGQDLFDELVEAHVDLILVGHDHVYERSKQLRVSSSCESVNSTNQFEPSCVAASGTQGVYAKGEGTIVVVQGVGGRSFDNVAIDGSNQAMGYFDAVMGANANTQGRLSGFGSVFYEVTANSIGAKTDFCPPDSTGTDGRCTSNPGAVFADQFAISTGTGLEPMSYTRASGILPDAPPASSASSFPQDPNQNGLDQPGIPLSRDEEPPLRVWTAR